MGAAHNDYVRVLVETGVLGLAAYLVVLVALLAVAVQAFRRARGPLARATAVAALGISVVYVLDSLIANLITQVVLLTYLVAVAALARGAWQSEDDEAPASLPRVRATAGSAQTR